MKRAYGIALGALGAASLGAGLMYLLDPSSGPRRRAALRDGARHTYREAAASLNRTRVNMTNRARGLAARAVAPLGREQVPNDDVLLARVRSRIGHVIAQPHAIEVKADHGRVSLTGALPLGDARKLVMRVAAIRGVSALETHLAMEKPVH